MRKTLVATLLVGALSLGLGYAIAQTTSKPKVPAVNATSRSDPGYPWWQP